MPGTRTAASTRSSAGRPVLTAREVSALQRLLAERAAAEGRPVPRPPARRKPASRTPASRTPASRTPRARAARDAGKAQRKLTRHRWSKRLALTVTALAVPALAALLLPSGAASHSGGAAPDATSLALTARTTLLDAAAAYRQAEQQVTQRTAELAKAEQTAREARGADAAARAAVGTSAADLYRASATGRYPVLGLDVSDPAGTAGVQTLQAVVDDADEHRQGAVVRAERADDAVATAGMNVAAARAALREAQRRAGQALAAVRATADGLSTDVTLALAGLSAAVPGPQQDRNAAAQQRWQAYLAALSANGIVPPKAAELADPEHLPEGFSPALDAQGQPVPGVAWTVIGSSPVTVVSTETVAAVSTALSQLGKPFVPGATGPDAYDCGGFTASSWLLAGYALPLTPADQWAVSTAVPVEELEVGDLVVGDGGLDVGLYLGSGDMVTASGKDFAVEVGPVPAGVRAVRVTLDVPATPNAALTPAAGMGTCGAPLPPPVTTDPAWGGYLNGRIPSSALCPLGVSGHRLRCDAAASYAAMSEAFRSAFGTPLCITDSYRDYAAKPRLAAWPGTSNHGWALAVDLCGGIDVAGTPQWTWMQANAGRFGFVNPPWAQPGAEKPEPWHWEYGNFG